MQCYFCQIFTDGVLLGPRPRRPAQVCSAADLLTELLHGLRALHLNSELLVYTDTP